MTHDDRTGSRRSPRRYAAGEPLQVLAQRPWLPPGATPLEMLRF